MPEINQEPHEQEFVDGNARAELADRVEGMAEQFWKGPVDPTRSSEPSGLLLSGDHEGIVLDTPGTLLAAAPGARVGSVTVRADATVVGLRVTGLATVKGDATAIFTGCIFERRTMPMVQLDSTATVHLVGCRFVDGGAATGDVVSGSGVGLSWMTSCSNKTGRPNGTNVTAQGVTT